jgi:hypothetical protein
MCWTKDRPVYLVGIADCCGGGICGIGPSLSIGGSQCNVGFTMRRDLLASLVKVTGLAVQMQYEWLDRSSSAVMPRLVSIFA